LIPNPILKVLSSMRAHRVRSLLMGGQACVLYGAAEFSFAILSEESHPVAEAPHPAFGHLPPSDGGRGIVLGGHPGWLVPRNPGLDDCPPLGDWGARMEERFFTEDLTNR